MANSSIFPSADGYYLADGWKTWYTISGYIDSQAYGPGASSSGESYHQTQLNGASVSLRFHGEFPITDNFLFMMRVEPLGCGIYVFGNATSPYSVTLDNRVVLEAGIDNYTNVLFADADLGQDDTHFITITVNISEPNTKQIFGLDRAVIESGLSNGWVPSNSLSQVGSRYSISTCLSADSPTSITYDSLNTTFFRYSSGWQTASVSDIPSAATPLPYKTTTGSAASLAFTISNATSVAANGMLDWGNGQYHVVCSNLLHLSRMWA